MRRGNLFPPTPHPAKWLTVVYEWSRKRIKERIQTLESALQKPVYEAFRYKYPEVGLPLYGEKVTDCFRLPKPDRAVPSASFEQNITALIEANLANRERAVQVLESTQNDLAEAANLLIAASSNTNQSEHNNH